MYKVEVKRTDDSSKFRQAAICFQKNGYYCPHPRGTTAYMKYWDEETKRCLEGFTTDDGEYVSGYYYFYLNYSPIIIVTTGESGKRGKRVRDFPIFWDYDRAFYDAVEEAEKHGKHLTFLKPRGVGASFKGSSMLCRNYFLIPESTSLAITEETESLTKDGILTKAWDIVDFINEHTAWSKKAQKINTKLHKRASLVVNNGATEIEVGYKSEIMGFSVKNNPDKGRGKRFKLAIVDEIGLVSSPIHLFSAMRHGAEEDGTSYGLIVLQGTGGTLEADYSEMRKLFYEPEVYNFLEIENTWDEGEYGKACGFFWPRCYNMRGFMDENGNSDYINAAKKEYATREHLVQTASDRNQIDRYVAERPMCPQESLMQTSNNIFPKKELMNHLNYIRTHKEVQGHKQVGDLIFDESGALKWEHAIKPKDITSYRIKKGESIEGQIVIWEHPVENPPYGLYIAGCLTPGEKVLTDIGLQNVEDIDYSRKLINKEGELVDIRALLRYNKVDEDIYTLKLSNNYRATTFTKEHPIYSSVVGSNKNLTISEDKFQFDFNKIKDIKVGDWVKVPNMYSKVIDYTCQFDNPYFWWFVGLWLGDGWCESNGNKITVAFNKLDEDYVKKFTHVVEKYFKRKVSIRCRGGNGIECCFCYTELSSYLSNTFGKYDIGKYIPEFVKYLPDYKKSQLIRGYLNSDGCITKHTKGYHSTEFVSINLEILEAIQDICFSLGLVSNVSKMRNAGMHNFGKKDCATKPCYHLRLGHTDTLRLKDKLIIHDLDEDSKLDKIKDILKIRKRSKNGCFISEDSKYIYFKIKKLDKSKYTGIVYNFECDTHSFMCRYIPTHNCDPYDHDQASTSPSLGSVFVYKRFQSFEKYYDLPVAEYTGRPNTVEEFYENVRKLCIYYNAKLLYENEKRGLFVHFAHKHCEYLLADQPNNVIKDIIDNSKVNRGKGIHMNKHIIQYFEIKLRDWLNEEYEPGKKNLTKILSEPLLEELIEYNPDGNFDRVYAYGLVMILREELYHIVVNDNKKELKSKMLFPNGLFKENMLDNRNRVEDIFKSSPSYAPWR